MKELIGPEPNLNQSQPPEAMVENLIAGWREHRDARQAFCDLTLAKELPPEATDRILTQALDEARVIAADVEINVLDTQITPPEVMAAEMEHLFELAGSADQQTAQAAKNIITLTGLTIDYLVHESRNGIAYQALQDIVDQQWTQVAYFLDQELSYLTAYTQNQRPQASPFFNRERLKSRMMVGQKTCVVGQIGDERCVLFHRGKSPFSSALKCIKNNEPISSVNDLIAITVLVEREPAHTLETIKAATIGRLTSHGWKAKEIPDTPSEYQSPLYQKNHFLLEITRGDEHRSTLEFKIMTPEQCLEEYYGQPNGDPYDAGHIAYKARSFAEAIRKMYPPDIWPDLNIDQRVINWAQEKEFRNRGQELAPLCGFPTDEDPHWKTNQPLVLK